MAVAPPVLTAIASSVVSGAMLPSLAMTDFATGLALPIIKSFLQRLVDFLLTDFAFAKRFRICAPVRDWEPKCSCHSIFLRLLHFPQLLLPLLALFCCYLLRRLVRIVSLSIPIEVFPFLPAPNGSHERVPKIVLALRIALHIVPFEVDAAAGAFFADSLEEIHDVCGAPLGVITTVGRRSAGLLM
jgi:hypothetical protein